MPAQETSPEVLIPTEAFESLPKAPNLTLLTDFTVARTDHGQEIRS
jgi:hypothetical protein